MASHTDVKCRRFEGKVAIVTASSTGIGFAIAERLAQEGAKVVISSRKESHVQEALDKLRSQGLEVCGVVCHAGKKEDRLKLIQKAVEMYGGLDIVVPNAAVSTAFGPILNTSEVHYDKMMDVNVRSVFMLVKEAVPYLQKRGGGSIVLVSSIGGYKPGDPIAIYGVTKTALFGLTKALVPQLCRSNIRINCLAPGLIDTKFSQAIRDDQNAFKETIRNIPMGRVGLPYECSAAAAFLASDDASYMTGETLVVAGGSLSRL